MAIIDYDIYTSRLLNEKLLGPGIFIILRDLNKGLECSSNLEKVINRIALFCKMKIG